MKRIRVILCHPGRLPVRTRMTRANGGHPVGAHSIFAGREIADVPAGGLLIKDGQQGWRYLSGRCGPAVIAAIGAIDRKMDDLAFRVLDTPRFGVAQTKEFDGIVVQPFQHISVMDVADLQFAIGPFEAGGGVGIRNSRGRHFEKNELVRIILTAIEPRFPARRFPALIPGDQKPVSYPIEQQKC